MNSFVLPTHVFSQKLQILTMYKMRIKRTDLADLFTIGSEVNKHWISKKDNESIIAKICQLDKNFNESVCAFIYEGKQDR